MVFSRSSSSSSTSFASFVWLSGNYEQKVVCLVFPTENHQLRTRYDASDSVKFATLVIGLRLL